MTNPPGRVPTGFYLLAALLVVAGALGSWVVVAIMSVFDIWQRSGGDAVMAGATSAAPILIALLWSGAAVWLARRGRFTGGSVLLGVGYVPALLLVGALLLP